MKQTIKLCKAVQPDYLAGTGVQAQLLNIRKINTHHHENALEMIYCLKGHVVGRLAHDVVELNEGDLLTCDRDDIHYLTAGEDNICLVAHIDLNHPNFSHDELINTVYSCTTHPGFVRHPELTETVCDLLLALMYEATGSDSNTSSRCEEIRLNLLDILTRKFSWFAIEEWFQNEELYYDKDMKYAGRFRQILAYIMQHYQEKITISELSEIIYLNPSYISNFLRRTTFHSLTATVNYFRCFHAEKLLLETDLSVGEISSLSGFSSEKYFYRSFKSIWQTTPLQHRKYYGRISAIKEEYHAYSPAETISIIKDHMAKRQVVKALHTKLP